VTARTVQGMARVRSGQTCPCPVVSGRSVRRGSGVKRDFACTCTRHYSPVLVALRSQSRLRLEGRTRTLSGPSPDLSPARTLAPSACRAEDLLIRRYPYVWPEPFSSVRDLGRVPARCSCKSVVREGCSSRWLPAWLPLIHNDSHPHAPGACYHHRTFHLRRDRTALMARRSWPEPS